MRRRALFAFVSAAAAIAIVALVMRRRPEPSWEPGLEFNPDFDLTTEEILADLRGEAPTA